LLTPGTTNARVYGPDYVVITSPSNGSIRMQDVRHTYLHYEIEPLLYARASSLDRLLPVLKAVSDAPLDFIYRSDIVSLVIECMIRAIEARTMDTGLQEFKIPPNVPRSELESYDRQRNASLQKISAVRLQAVSQSMAQGYVLTQYFYEQLIGFERTPISLKESIGEMVYGMDVDSQIHRARQVEFVQQGSSDVVRHTPRQLRGLDLAEMKLMKGDPAGAGQLAKQAIDQHTAEPDRANFILARVDLMNGKIDDAESAFRETVRLSKDPRTLAWSHIYLGRILDVQEERDNALTEYRAALTVRDGQPDTKSAAEKGLKQPFALPHHQQSSDSDADDDAAPPAKPPAASGTTSPH
jgi:tetratricopeptide (TPR) repeat protein